MLRKKGIFTKVLVLVFSMLFLTSCGKWEQKGKIGLLSEKVKDAEINQIRLYTFDGKSTERYYLSEADDAKQVIEELSGVVIEKSTQKEFSFDILPWFGLDIQFKKPKTETTDSTYYFVSDGSVLLTDKGESFVCKFDFSQIFNKYNWELQETFENAGKMPCASQLFTQTESRKNYLKCVKTIEQMADIEISTSVDEKNSNIITAEIKYFGKPELELSTLGIGIVHEEIEGNWYEIPICHSPSYFALGAYPVTLKTGDTYTVMMDLERLYGQLPKGHYRWSMLVERGLYVEFEVDKSGKVIL